MHFDFAADLNSRSANVPERRKSTLTPSSSATLIQTPLADASLQRLSQPLSGLRRPCGVKARGDSTWESDLGDGSLLYVLGIKDTEP